jgi:hypothetical protein
VFHASLDAVQLVGVGHIAVTVDGVSDGLRAVSGHVGGAVAGLVTATEPVVSLLMAVAARTKPLLIIAMRLEPWVTAMWAPLFSIWIDSSSPFRTGDTLSALVPETSMFCWSFHS